MDAEHETICALIAEGSTAPLHDAHITAEHFPTHTHRKVLDWVLDHQARYGQVPASDTLRHHFPGYQLHTPREPIAVYLDQLRTEHRKALLEEGLGQAVAALADGKIDASEAALARLSTRMNLAAPRASHLNLSGTGAGRLERYAGFKDFQGALRGIPTGFPTIDRATLGLQGGQLVAIGGLPKGGKSALLGTIALNMHRDAHRSGVELSPMIVTIEMSNEEFAERLDAWAAGIDTLKLRAGELNAGEWKRLREAIETADTMAAFHLERGIAQVCTISEINAKVERHRPDALLVDGVYLMKDEATGEVNTPQAITSLTRSFKAMAQRWDIPVVISSQFLHAKVGRQGSTGASFGYASSFEQDADVAFGLDRTDDDNVKRLKILASRNCPLLEVYLRWDWSSGTFEELDEDPFVTASGGTGARSW